MKTMKEAEQKNKYAMKILISCCLFYGAIAGMLVNCNGQFYSSIAESLDAALGDVTVSSAIMGIASLLATPFVIKIYRTRNARAVTATAILVYCLSHMMTVFVDALWKYYLLSVLRGFFQGFLVFYLASSLIKEWFTEKSGMALSITAFSSGIAGIIFNLLIGFGMDYIGWKDTLVISCIAAILISLPGMCLFLYRSPDEMIGADRKIIEKEKERPKGNEIGSIFVFLLGLVMNILWVLPYCFTQHLKVFAISEGFNQMTGAALISISMAGNIVSKLLLSILSDRFGAKRTAEIMLTGIVIGFILLLLPPKEVFLFGGSFLLGAGASFIPIVIPQTVSTVYTGGQFNTVYSKYSTVLSMTSAVWISVIGLLYSFTGSYRPLFIAGLLLIITSFCMLQLFAKQGRKDGHKNENKKA